MHVLFLIMSYIVIQSILCFMSLIWSAFVNMWCYDWIGNTIQLLIYYQCCIFIFKLWRYTCIWFFSCWIVNTYTHICQFVVWFGTHGRPGVPIINPMGMGLGTN
jgi:hypothetical protein